MLLMEDRDELLKRAKHILYDRQPYDGVSKCFWLDLNCGAVFVHQNKDALQEVVSIAKEILIERHGDTEGSGIYHAIIQLNFRKICLMQLKNCVTGHRPYHIQDGVKSDEESNTLIGLERWLEFANEM